MQAWSHERNSCSAILERRRLLLHCVRRTSKVSNLLPKMLKTHDLRRLKEKWRKVKKQWRAAAPKKTAARGPAGSKWNRQLKNGEKQSEPGSPARPEI